MLDMLQSFETNVYNFRAWTHFAVGSGWEEGDIQASQEKVIAILTVSPHPLAASHSSSQLISSSLDSAPFVLPVWTIDVLLECTV